jgi:60 kDa SS-A/Ro ribonucleoprotein
MSYLERHGRRRVPQSAPIRGAGQVPNSAGGFAWEVDDWTRLRRFLILGSEGGSYYATQWTLTRENAQAVERCVRADGRRAVAEVVRVSEEGRAPKNDPALFALAIATGLGEVETRWAALDALPRVARTGTHLFQFATFVEQFRGWGCSLRRAVGVVRVPGGGRPRLPGGQVPRARRRHAPRPPAPGAPGGQGVGR